METTALEHSLFRFIALNTIIFSGVTRLTKFKFSSILTVTLKKLVIKQKTHSKKQLKDNIDMGILTGQISVMKLDLDSKTKCKYVHKILG